MKPQSLIATNTLGMGARAGEIAACKSDPKGWLEHQIRHPSPLNIEYESAPSVDALFADYRDLMIDVRNRRRDDPKANVFSFRKDIRSHVHNVFWNEINLSLIHI